MLRATTVAIGAAIAASQGVIVTEKGGSVTDGSSMWNTFAMARYSNFPKSFALSDTGTFGRLAWGIGGNNPVGIADYATQGSLIAEKLLSLGSDLTRAVVKGWLAKAPLNDDGHVFGTEGSEFHGGGQGAFEGNAEFILIARHYAAFSGDARSFNTTFERFVCFTDTQGNTKLAGAGHPGLDDSACSMPPGQIVGMSEANGWRFYSEGAFIAPYNQTIGNSTLRKTVHAHGKAPLQYVTLPVDTNALSFALTSGAPPQAQWPLVISIVDTASLKVVRNASFPPVSGNGWTSFDTRDSSGNPLPAGSYMVILAFDPLAAPPSFSGVRSTPHSDSLADALELGAGMPLPQWVIDVGPASPGGSSYQTFLEWDVSNPLAQWTSAPGGAPILPQTKPLGAQLNHALWWQLNNAFNPATGEYDALMITDPIYRGTDEAAVNSGCSYYDLFRMGYVASYINLRFLESMLAYQELQAAGLVPLVGPNPAELATMVGQVRAALTKRFALPSGGVLSWYGCKCVNETSTQCPVDDAIPGSTNPCIQAWDLGFLPSQALAVKLGVIAGNATSSTLQAMREAATVQPGLFRTNTVSYEDVSPMLWLAADRWNYKDAESFALREAKQTGDWMIFDPATGAADGNGNYGLQEENGGVLLSTSSFILEVGNGGPNASSAPPDPAVVPYLPRSGPYPNMYRDWAYFVGRLSNITDQLAAGDTSSPLLAAYPGFLRLPINSTLVQDLCAAPRGSGALTNKDPWGQAWCDYYKSISFDLPEDGLALWSFARGMLGLYIDASGGLSVLGTPLPVPGGDVYLALPQGWPAEVSTVAVNGLCVGALRNVTVSCSVMADVGALECTSSSS